MLKISKKTWSRYVKSATISAFRIAIRSIDFRAFVKKSTIIPQEKKLKHGEAHVNNLAVMFIDIVNFTGIKADDSNSQQRLLMQLDFLFTELFRAVEKHGGRIEKNTGDGLMAYFDKKEDKNAVVRAIECAVTLMTIGEYIIHPTFKSNILPSLKFRITIDYGLITLAKIGVKGKFKSLVAIGKAANLASKMQSVTGENQIVIGRFAYEQLPQSLKKFAFLHKAVKYKVRTKKDAHFFDQCFYATFLFKGRWSNKNGFFMRLEKYE